METMFAALIMIGLWLALEIAKPAPRVEPIPVRIRRFEDRRDM